MQNKTSNSTETITKPKTRSIVLRLKNKYFTLKEKSAEDVINESISLFFEELDRRVETKIEKYADKIKAGISESNEKDKENTEKYLFMGIILSELKKMTKEYEGCLNIDEINRLKEIMSKLENANNNEVDKTDIDEENKQIYEENHEDQTYLNQMKQDSQDYGLNKFNNA